MTKTCIICGKEFEPYRPAQVTCSVECRKVYRLDYIKKYQKKHPEKVRKYNKEIYRINYARELKKRKPVTCPICGKEFIPQRKRIYCSKECSKIANAKRTRKRYWKTHKPKYETLGYFKHKDLKGPYKECGVSSCFDCKFEDCIV